jgi:hypothetical protein
LLDAAFILGLQQADGIGAIGPLWLLKLIS